MTSVTKARFIERDKILLLKLISLDSLSICALPYMAGAGVFTTVVIHFSDICRGH
jgi:hypothetical protein